MRKWQVDPMAYLKKRDKLVKSITRFPMSGDEREAQRDFLIVARNFDALVQTAMDLNYRFRFKERTPQGYRKLEKKLDEYLLELENLSIIYQLTYGAE